jgi:hypothetical protein
MTNAVNAHILLRDTLGIPVCKGRIRSVMGLEAIDSVGMLSSLLIAVATLEIITFGITTLRITTIGIATLGSTGYTLASCTPGINCSSILFELCIQFVAHID